MKKRIMAVLATALLVTSMAVSVFANSQGGNNAANQYVAPKKQSNRPADADVYDYWAEKGDSNSTTPWIGGPVIHTPTLLEWLAAFQAYETFLGEKDIVLAAGPITGPQIQVSNINFVPGQSYTILVNYPNGSVTSIKVQCDPNHTLTADRPAGSVGYGVKGTPTSP